MSEIEQQESASLEDTFLAIEEIIDRMEQQDVTLDESFNLYRQGIDKLKSCNAMLDRVEKQLQILDVGEEED